ncbi:hypothetical protein ACFWY9_10575 [Amycolatopsis sp. NPDC059027]|uniref:hypothetical protein n=1 Tax=Amycolatopsis sp. NPDC059027 TaxID=3346709 RepID=UPI00366AA534
MSRTSAASVSSLLQGLDAVVSSSGAWSRRRARQTRLRDTGGKRTHRRVRHRDDRRRGDDSGPLDQAERVTLQALLTKIAADLPRPPTTGSSEPTEM